MNTLAPHKSFHTHLQTQLGVGRWAGWFWHLTSPPLPGLWCSVISSYSKNEVGGVIWAEIPPRKSLHSLPPALPLHRPSFPARGPLSSWGPAPQNSAHWTPLPPRLSRPTPTVPLNLPPSVPGQKPPAHPPQVGPMPHQSCLLNALFIIGWNLVAYHWSLQLPPDWSLAVSPSAHAPHHPLARGNFLELPDSGLPGLSASQEDSSSQHSTPHQLHLPHFLHQMTPAKRVLIPHIWVKKIIHHFPEIKIELGDLYFTWQPSYQCKPQPL